MINLKKILFWVCCFLLIAGLIFCYVKRSAIKKLVKSIISPTISAQTLDEFVDRSPPEKTVFLFELNNYHHECIPGYTKYFTDLGYNVDIVVIKDSQDCMIKFKPQNKVKIFTFDSEDDLMANSEKIRSKLEKYDYIFLNSTDSDDIYPGRADKYEQLGILNNEKTIFVGHDLGGVNAIKKVLPEETFSRNRVITLSKFDIGNFVNPHYFGDFNRKEKNETTKFFLTSTGDGRKYDTFIKAMQNLKNEGLDFKVIVTGRSDVLSEKDLPEELATHFEFQKGVSYEKLYSLVQECDYIILPCDPDSDDLNTFRTRRASGSTQLMYGFLKPMIVVKELADLIELDSENAHICYKNEVTEIANTLKKAINSTKNEYKTMQSNLERLQKRIYDESLENFKKAL